MPCWFVLVGSGYLHTLLVGVSLWLVLVGSGYLHTLNLVPAGSCVLVVRVCSCVLVGSDYLATLNLVPAGSCALWFVLVGSGYLHALNLVPCWLVCPCGWCWLEVVTCTP